MLEKQSLDSSDGSYAHKNWDRTPTWLLNTFFLCIHMGFSRQIGGSWPKNPLIHHHSPNENNIQQRCHPFQNRNLPLFLFSFTFHNIWNLSPLHGHQMIGKWMILQWILAGKSTIDWLTDDVRERNLHGKFGDFPASHVWLPGMWLPEGKPNCWYIYIYMIYPT